MVYTKYLALYNLLSFLIIMFESSLKHKMRVLIFKGGGSYKNSSQRIVDILSWFYN